MKRYYFSFILPLTLLFSNCSEDSPSPIENEVPCSGYAGWAYMEKDGILIIDPESDAQTHNWNTRSDIGEFLGNGYVIWEGDSYMNAPGNEPITFNIEINKTGTYQFIWRSRIAKGNEGTEHNDSWLRFADAADFYGLKGDHYVYPGGTGKTPTPAGTSKEGWFKVYMNGTGQWKWQAKTSDNDAHNIFVEFDSPGTYTMEISARSSFHAIDRIALIHNSINLSDGTGTVAVSEIQCFN